MAVLILGLLLFLGVHSVRIVADGWRTQMQARMGAGAWKGTYALLSALGLGLIIWGYGAARQQPVVLWAPPAGMRHLASLLMLVSIILLVAAYVPGNTIKSRLHHPMLLGVKLWALAHLLSNQTLADVLLFGSFLLWAVLDFRSSRRRDRTAGTSYPPGRAGPTVASVGLGVLIWAGIAFWAHAAVIGVRPF